jgi:hypothetical protein
LNNPNHLANQYYIPSTTTSLSKKTQKIFPPQQGNPTSTYNRPPGPYDPLRRADTNPNANGNNISNPEEGKILSSEYRTTFTEEEQTTLTQFLAFHGAVPVFPTEETLNSAGAAEQVLFSLFHYIVEMEELGKIQKLPCIVEVAEWGKEN